MTTPLFHNETVESNRIIYTPSDFARNCLFFLQETGTLQAKFPHTSSRQNLNSYLFFIVKSGTGLLKYGNQIYNLKKNDCVFIDCHKPYLHSTSDKPWQLQWVHFYGNNIKFIYNEYQNNGGMCCFQTDRLNVYQEILNQIYIISTSDFYLRDMEIHLNLSSLLFFLMQDGKNIAQKTNNISSDNVLSIQAVKDYIDENYIQKISLDNLEKKFFINKYYLVRLFKKQYGFTVNDYIIRLRITKGKKLLRFSNKTIEEISYECGVQNSAYFSRIFKKIEGVSPSEYRKLWQTKSS